jgi:4-amino-4-deoxy-L-arabinose transferase-like glycosyltransferase
VSKSIGARFALLALLIVSVCSTTAIVMTYPRLSHTIDEGTHVAAGLEVWQDRRYTYQTENPPLSRMVLAVIPYLEGARLPPATQRPQGPTAAAEIFYRTPQYVRHVTEGRLGNLLFFWACVALTWLLAGGAADPWASFLGSAAVATLPPIVAHAGLATTDVPFVASFLLALLALRRLMARPTLRTAALAGVALGLAVATKFSTLVFLPPAVIAIVVCRYWDDRRQWLVTISTARPWVVLGTTALIATVVVWGCYGFRVGRLSDLPTRFGPYGNMPTSGWPAVLRDWRLPGHELLHGLLYLKVHTEAGHRAMLFDQFSQRGFLLYYPVVLATKTPVPFLAFAALGLIGASRARAHPQGAWFAGLAFAAVGVLLIALSSPINLGVRHVLVIYPLVALASAFGWVRWAERVRHGRWILTASAGCLALQLGLLLTVVPNQITYFNVFAGADPAYISNDADFDWGQDALALEQYFSTHTVPELYIEVSRSWNPCVLRLPPLKVLPLHQVTGWVAVSERVYRLNRGLIQQDPCAGLGAPGQVIAPPGWLDWLKRYQPVATIGKTIRLYHIPESK